jgi:hypothetical protein
MRLFFLIPAFWMLFSLPVAAEPMFGLLADDCFNEWKTRGWVIGEDNTPAHEVERFATGIRKICEVRSQMFVEDPEISPYIQGRLAELAPYVFSGDEEAIRTLVSKLKQRRPGHQFSGSFMRD